MFWFVTLSLSLSQKRICFSLFLLCFTLYVFTLFLLALFHFTLFSYLNNATVSAAPLHTNPTGNMPLIITKMPLLNPYFIFMDKGQVISHLEKRLWPFRWLCYACKSLSLPHPSLSPSLSLALSLSPPPSPSLSLNYLPICTSISFC